MNNKPKLCDDTECVVCALRRMVRSLIDEDEWPPEAVAGMFFEVLSVEVPEITEMVILDMEGDDGEAGTIH